MNTSKTLLPRHVLVAVDAGPLSDHAVLAALDMARRFDARVELVHAVDSFVEARGMVPDPRAPEARAADLARAKGRVLDHLATLLDAEHGGRARAEELLHVFQGRPARVVLERAGETGADLIVLGARSRRSVFDFGSTARAVLAQARCPVLVQPGPVRPVARILVPVDLSEESLLALKTACEWGRRYRAKVTAMHAFEMVALMAIPWDGYSTLTDLDLYRKQSVDEFERVMREFDWLGVEHDLSFVDGRPADVILDQGRAADMIVMGTHGRSRFAAALLGSVAHEVLRMSSRPVMVVRRPTGKPAS